MNGIKENLQNYKLNPFNLTFDTVNYKTIINMRSRSGLKKIIKESKYDYDEAFH